MQSVMKHSFSHVPHADIQRSAFDRPSGYKTTLDTDYIYPVFVDEVLPGDTHTMDATYFARMNTPIYPLLDNLFMHTFWFFVPSRLVWTNFQKFMGEQTDPDDSTDYVVPQVVAPAVTGWTVGELWDYFGIPTDVPNLSVNALPSRAYQLIYNEWFRDQNLIDSVTVDKGNGPDSESNYELRKRGKRHDYFTSCLPWPQKDPDSIISLPLGTEAPVLGLGKSNTAYNAGPRTVYESGQSGTTSFASYQNTDVNSADTAFFVEEDPNNAGYPYIRADLENAVAPTINELREAIQLQRMLEKDARGGTRYTEILRSHFGVTSPDARLQRPEYLGGSTAPVRMTPVPQTSETNTTSQGTLSAFGTVTARSSFVKSFTEHGYILGLVNLCADLTYSQGLNRMWSRETRFDFYWPTLQHLGEQVVYQQEIYAVDPSTDTDSDGTPDNLEAFGYQERYAEYKYKPSLITGKLRPTAAGSLAAWHLSQEFASAPTLSKAFIEEAVPMERVVAVDTEPDFLFDAYFKLRSVRPMALYSVPGYIDHF